MRDTFLGRRWWVLAVAVTVLSAAVGATARAGLWTRPSAWLQAALTPVEQAIHNGFSAGSRAASDVSGLWALHQENAALRAQVARLQAAVLQDARVQSENVTLRQMLHLQQSVPARFGAQGLVAQVIGRDPSTWFQSLVLNKGTSDGVTAGMVAITPAGLVGRVVPPVAPHSAQLMLITNAEFGVGTMAARSRAEGVAVGRLGSTTLVMTFFSPDASVRPGDAIVTSGIGGAFPQGIPVGSVGSVRLGGAGLVRQAVVRPAVDIAGVGAVLLLPPSGGG